MSVSKIRAIELPERWIISCPATGDSVSIPRDGRWTYNSNPTRPTFSPSINNTTGFAGETHEQMAQGRISQRNHFFVRDGFIEYCSDCTHDKAGQTMELEPFPPSTLAYYNLCNLETDEDREQREDRSQAFNDMCEAVEDSNSE